MQAVVLTLWIMGWAVTVRADLVFNESFETDGQGTRYTASTPFNKQGNYWDRGQNADFATLVAYANPDGSYFWAAEDVDATQPGGNGNPIQTLDFTAINIAGFTNLVFSGRFASSGNSLGAGFPFDDIDDGIKIQYRINGGAWQNGLCFAPVNAPTLNNLAHDTDCDGSGDGAVLTEDFTSASNPFTFNIPDGALLDLHIEVKADSSSEELAFDFFQINGDPILTNQAPTAVLFDAADVCEPEIGNTAYNFTITYTDNSAVDISTIDINDVGVTWDGGGLLVTSAVEPNGTDGAPRMATYTVTPPGGSWDAADNDTYIIGMTSNEVGDDGAPQLFVAADPALTTFDVNATNAPPEVNDVLAEDVIFPNFCETTYTFTIEYSDVSGIDVSSIDTNDVTVTGLGGSLIVTGSNVNNPVNGSPRTATYTVIPPGGTWDITDTGTYTIGVVSGEVLDVLGGSVSPNPALTTFDVLPNKLLNESFETDGQSVRYTASQPFNSGPDGYWNRGTNADFDTLLPYVSPAGDFFWAVEDTDEALPGGNGNPVQTLEFTGINIAAHTGLEFSGLFAATQQFFGIGFPYNAGQGEHIKVLYQVNGAGYQNGVWFTANADSHLALDTDFDGTGDGAELIDTFLPYSFGVPDGNTLDLRIEVKADSASEEVAFDSLMVTGDYLGGFQGFDGGKGVSFTTNGAAVVNSNSARLTENLGSQVGSVIFGPLLPDPIKSFEAYFDFRIGPSSSGGADGMSFALMDANIYDSTAIFGEDGPGPNSLAISFDTFNNGPPEPNDNFVEIRFNGSSVATADPTFNLDATQWHHADISFDSNNLTLILTPNGGSPVTVFDAISVPAFTPFVSLYGFGARTGGVSSEHRVDNVRFVNTSDTDGDGIIDECDEFPGCNNNANLYLDDIINFLDFAVLADDYNCISGCTADIDGDDDTDIEDLLFIVTDWLCGTGP
jgi:hypothetical protein